MSTHEKLLTKMRNNPRNWQLTDLLAVAERYDIEIRNNGGSHHVFSFPGVSFKPCVPAHRPIKPVYIKQFLMLIDKVRELQ